MSYAVILGARGANMRHFFDVHGECILARHPGKILLCLDNQLRGKFPEQPNCRIEYLKYMDEHALAELLQGVHAQEGVTSIATLDEALVETAATQRAALGLPGMAPEVAHRFRNKVLMKQLLAGAGVRVPDFLPSCADTAAVRALLARHGKIVIKPHDGFGSRDVTCVNNPSALEACLASLRKPDAFEAEEFIDGTLYHSNSVVSGGKVLYTGLAPYQPGMANIDYSAGQPFVTLMETSGPVHDALCAFSERVVQVLGMEGGVTHLEAFVRASGEIVFCEVGARPGGGGIVHMIDLQDGVNLSLAALLCATGDVAPALRAARRRTDRIGLIGLRNNAMGVVRLAGSDQQLTRDWIHHREVNVQEGVFRAPSAHCTDFTAMFVLDAADPDQFKHRIDDISNSFSTYMQLIPL